MLIALMKILMNYYFQTYQAIVQIKSFKCMWKGRRKSVSCFTCELPGFKTYLQLALLEFPNLFVPPYYNLQNKDANSISFIGLS